MHLGTNEHLWAVMRAHQLEREDMSPSQSRHETPKERQTRKRNSVLKYTRSGISAPRYPKSLHNVAEESSEAPIKDVRTVLLLTFWKVGIPPITQTRVMSSPAMVIEPPPRGQ